MRLELRQSHRSKPAFLKTPSLSAAGESNREVFAAGNPALELLGASYCCSRSVGDSGREGAGIILWSWNFDRLLRRGRWNGNGLWHRRVWDRFRDINWLRPRLMCAHHAGRPPCATSGDCVSRSLLYFESRLCISSKIPVGERAGMSRHVPNHTARRCFTRADSP